MEEHHTSWFEEVKIKKNTKQTLFLGYTNMDTDCTLFLQPWVMNWSSDEAIGVTNIEPPTW